MTAADFSSKRKQTPHLESTPDILFGVLADEVRMQEHTAVERSNRPHKCPLISARSLEYSDGFKRARLIQLDFVRVHANVEGSYKKRFHTPNPKPDQRNNE